MTVAKYHALASPTAASLERRRWHISGRVQGVGFRPFVLRVARQHHLTGFVINDGNGVVVEAQGIDYELDGFAHDIRAAKPQLAIIDDMAAETVDSRKGECDFVIEKSRSTGSSRTEIAPDLALCPDCARELRDPKDCRRFGYGLINCTACGPRFSIIRGVPYDRPKTTMAAFAMCELCRAEYEKPSDRRFHAQPTACKTCGPKVQLVSPAGLPIEGDPIQQTVERLRGGQIIAIKGIGGFHLAVRADNAQAVERLRQTKHRAHKPFALMVASLEKARRLVILSERGDDLFTSSAAPIVLAPRRLDADVAPNVAPGNHRLGVMLAYTPIHHLIFDAIGDQCPALVMTSANDSDEPLIFTHEEAVKQLGRMCDAILWHQRPIERPVDDSVLIDAGDRDPILLRRSRGYAPASLKLSDQCHSDGICVGGELKNTVAIVRGREAVLSQHLGDLEHPRTFSNFMRSIDDLLELLAVKPQWVAHDLHPGYVSTRFAIELARKFNVPQFEFQHHYAHAAAVLAEHGQTGPALAIVCDGTGFGADGSIWGGELLTVDFEGFSRLGHLRQILLPGGDAAAKQTWRCAMALLLNAYGEKYVELPILRQIVPNAASADFVSEMLRTQTNCFRSSAAGRVFDGVAAILGLAGENHFEAQAPLALESAAAAYGEGPRRNEPLFELQDVGSTLIDLSPLIRHLVSRQSEGAPVEESAAIFHDQFAAAWEAAVAQAAEKTGLKTVVLSGGVMCNQIIDRLLTDRLTKRGLHVLRHRLVPPNDGGLAFGQAALAAYRASNGAR